MSRRPLWVVSLLCCAGCFYPGDRGRALEQRVDKLANDNAELSAQLREANEKVTSRLPVIDQKIAEVSTALDNLDKAARRSDADIGVQMQKAVEDVAQLRGQVDEYVHKIDDLDAQLKKLAEDTDTRFTELKGTDAVKAAEARKKADVIERPKDKKEFLALADAKAKEDLAVGRQLYAEWLKKWPKDELAGEAHYGLGETFYSDNKPREALFEYGKVIQEHPKTKSAPMAYLRSAQCFRQLKMTDEAKLALEELLKSYPKTDAAKTARTQLSELEKEKKKAKPTAAKTGAKKGTK